MENKICCHQRSTIALFTVLWCDILLFYYFFVFIFCCVVVVVLFCFSFEWMCLAAQFKTQFNWIYILFVTHWFDCILTEPIYNVWEWIWKKRDDNKAMLLLCSFYVKKLFNNNNSKKIVGMCGQNGEPRYPHTSFEHTMTVTYHS